MKKLKQIFKKFISGHFLPVMFLIIIPLMLYYPSIKYNFTGTDDIQLIRTNQPFYRPLNNVFHLFKTNSYVSPNNIDFYRPVQMLSFIVDAQFQTDKRPLLPFHITSIILQIITLLLLYYLLVHFNVEKIPAFLSACIFAVHPLIAASVVWIPARGDQLAAVFTLLAVIAFIRVQEGKKCFVPLHMLFFACAIFSKEIAAAAPVIFLLVDKLLLKNKIFTWKNALLAIFWFCIEGIYFSMRSFGWSKDYPEGMLTGWDAFLKNITLVPVLLSKVFLPYDLSTYAVFKSWSVFAGFLIIAILALLVIVDKRRKGIYIFGFLWFLSAGMPYMFFRMPYAESGREYFESWAYFPVMGIVIAAGYILNTFRESRNYALTCSGFAVVSAFLAWGASAHARDFANPYAFADSALRSYGNNAFAYLDRGQWKFNSRFTDDGIRDITRSIELCPRNDFALYIRGTYYFYTRRNAEARKDLEMAIQIDRTYLEAYMMKGWVDFTDKQYDAAIADFAMAIKLNPSSAWSRFIRGKIYEQIGDYENALDDISTASFMADNNSAFQDDLRKVKRKLREQKALEKEQSEEPER